VKADAKVRPARAPWRGLLIPAGLAFCLLIGLGTWQIKRKAWKEGLIAKLHAELSAAPIPLPPPAQWKSIDRSAFEYHRVKFAASFENGKDALVFAAPSAFRPDVSGPGDWVFTPAKLAGGAVVMVNRGFIPDGWQDVKTRAQAQPSGPVDIVGALRWPDERHWFTPNDDPAHNLWFMADPQAIAAAKGVGPVAPFYVEQESPVPPGGLPKPGKLVVSLPDNHLQYALTWYGLALVLVIWFGSWAYSYEREKADAGAAPPSPPGTRS
jgi:surfeit locus 1 family protein